MGNRGERVALPFDEIQHPVDRPASRSPCGGRLPGSCYLLDEQRTSPSLAPPDSWRPDISGPSATQAIASLPPWILTTSSGSSSQFAFEPRFFTEIERFDRHLEKLRRGPDDQRVHMVSVCSPNYLHDAHCRLALRIGADVICEKPLVINPWNLGPLQDLEAETGRKIIRSCSCGCIRLWSRSGSSSWRRRPCATST